MSIPVAAGLALHLGLPQEDRKVHEVPKTFESGARKLVPEGVKAPETDEKNRKKYEALAAAGKVDDIVNELSTWMPCVIEGLLSDDEKIARGSGQALHKTCEKHKISSREDRFENPVRLDFFNSAHFRAGEYDFWSAWWGQNQAVVREWGAGGRDESEDARKAEDARNADWDNMMSYLRTGGGLDDPERAEGFYFARIKRMGKYACPHLIKYIDHEELPVARAAVMVLNALTGQSKPLPTAGSNRAQMKAEWEAWLKSLGTGALLEVVKMMVSDRTEAEVRFLLAELASVSHVTRSRAQEELGKCALPHADLIRKAHDRAEDAEVRCRLDPIVQDLPRWQADEARLRAKPGLLLEVLERLPAGTPEDLRRRIEKLHRDLKK